MGRKYQLQRQLKAINELVHYDHAFLSPEGVKRFTEPFGMEVKTYLAKANPMDFKGLTLNNGMAEAEGQDAHRVAEQICEHLGLTWHKMFGIGSELRECCEVARKHIEAELAKI